MLFEFSDGWVEACFDMTKEEQDSVLSLLNQAQRVIEKEHAPDGYNIGVNVGNLFKFMEGDT